MATYKLWLRSFAPWLRFGALTKSRAITVPAVTYHPPSMFDSGVTFTTAQMPYGGDFHGDGRGFSLETANPRVTSRVNALLEVNLGAATAGRSDTWCDESEGPWMGVGFEKTAVGTPKTEFSVSKNGLTVNAVI